MKDRTRFETELVDLGLQQAPTSLRALREFEVADAFEAETPDWLDEYRIRDGLYTREQKRRAAEHPKGLLLTASFVGKEERKLATRGPSTVSIGKELTRFKNGKLGEFVANFNEFTYFFDEVLREIGRLRDLVSAGCPEAPQLMTPRQKHALRPTDDRSGTNNKKIAYRLWRSAQLAYAVTDRDGKLVKGIAYDAPKLARSVARHRQAYWQAQGDLSRTLEKHHNKPQYQMISVKISDIASVVLAGKGAATSALVLGADLLLEARKNREEYNAKMKEFLAAVETRNEEIEDKLEKHRVAGESYWDAVETVQGALTQRDMVRRQARLAAGDFGQSLPSRSESRKPVLAEIRMPALVADAWRVLAMNGEEAKNKISTVVNERELVLEAKFHFEKPRPEEIKKLVAAYNYAVKREPVLNRDEVKIWLETNKLWNEQFNKFNV